MTFNKSILASIIVTSSLLNVGCDYSDDDSASNNSEGRSGSAKVFTPYVGTDLNSKTSSFMSLNPEGPGGSPNQSLRGGDVVIGGISKMTF